MPKFLIRLFVLLLVPCLLGDPSYGAIAQIANPTTAHVVKRAKLGFEAQALSPAQSVAKFRSPFDLRLTLAVLAGVVIQWILPVSALQSQLTAQVVQSPVNPGVTKEYVEALLSPNQGPIEILMGMDIINRSPNPSLLPAILKAALNPALEERSRNAILERIQPLLIHAQGEKGADLLGLQELNREMFVRYGWLVLGASDEQLALFTHEAERLQPLLEKGRKKILLFRQPPATEQRVPSAHNNNGVIVFFNGIETPAAQVVTWPHEIGHDIIPYGVKDIDDELIRQDFEADSSMFRLLGLYNGSTAEDKNYPAEQTFSDMVMDWRFYSEHLFMANVADFNTSYRRSLQRVARAYTHRMGGQLFVRVYPPSYDDSIKRSNAKPYTDIPIPSGSLGNDGLLSYETIVRLYLDHLPVGPTKRGSFTKGQAIAAQFIDYLHGGHEQFLPVYRVPLRVNPQDVAIRAEFWPSLLDLESRQRQLEGESIPGREAYAIVNYAFSYSRIRADIRQRWEAMLKEEHPEITSKEFEENFLDVLAAVLDKSAIGDPYPARYGQFMRNMLKDAGLSKMVDLSTPKTSKQKSRKKVVKGAPFAIAPGTWYGRLFALTLQGEEELRGRVMAATLFPFQNIELSTDLFQLRHFGEFLYKHAMAGNVEALLELIPRLVAPAEETRVFFIEPVLKKVEEWKNNPPSTDQVTGFVYGLVMEMMKHHEEVFLQGFTSPLPVGTLQTELITAIWGWTEELREVLIYNLEHPDALDFAARLQSAFQTMHRKHAEHNATRDHGQPLAMANGKSSRSDIEHLKTSA